MTAHICASASDNGSLFTLLRLRGQERLFAAALTIGLLAGWLGMTRLNAPLWAATVLIVGLLSYPAVRKWRADRQLGMPAAVLSMPLHVERGGAGGSGVRACIRAAEPLDVAAAHLGFGAHRRAYLPVHRLHLGGAAARGRGPAAGCRSSLTASVRRMGRASAPTTASGWAS